MYVQPQEQQLFGGFLGASGITNGNMLGNGLLGDDGIGSIGTDGISRLIAPSASGASGTIGGLPSAMPLVGVGAGIGPILNSVINMLRQLLQTVSGSGNSSGNGNQTYFQQADASSTGDPHLSFNGQRWDSMTDHPDLLTSDSFNGGFQIATQVSQPNANGVTTNQSASVITENGSTSITLDQNGNAAILQNGQSTSIANGQTLGLGNGETVGRDQDGTLHVTDNNGAAGSIAATLRSLNGGVDVNAKASNVDLGGDLVSGASGDQRHPSHEPRWNRAHEPRWSNPGVPRYTLPIDRRLPPDDLNRNLQ